MLKNITHPVIQTLSIRPISQQLEKYHQSVTELQVIAAFEEKKAKLLFKIIVMQNKLNLLDMGVKKTL